VFLSHNISVLAYFFCIYGASKRYYILTLFISHTSSFGKNLLTSLCCDFQGWGGGALGIGDATEEVWSLTGKLAAGGVAVASGLGGVAAMGVAACWSPLMDGADGSGLPSASLQRKS